MPFYMPALVLGLIAIILGLINTLIEGIGTRKKIVLILATIIAALGAVSLFITSNVPKPEIYTTNGNSFIRSESKIELFGG